MHRSGWISLACQDGVFGPSQLCFSIRPPRPGFAEGKSSVSVCRFKDWKNLCVLPGAPSPVLS